MNCSQARVLLATHRELQSNQEEAGALQEHLCACATCQQAQTHYHHIGTQIRSLPQIEPSPDAHAKLMHALAVEHVRVIQRTHSSAASIPTPTFLIPYVLDLGKQDRRTNNLVAFSSAETGPLPIAPRLKRRPIHQMRHFAIIGVAASFLMILMVGGLTSLLLLSSSPGRNLQPPPNNSASINQPHDVQAANFSTTATYPSIASATIDGNSIFYTSYSDQAADWDLEQFDTNTQKSISLLDAPSTDELFILGSSAQWLVWLQIAPPPVTQVATPTPQAGPSATPTPTPDTLPNGQQSSTTDYDRQWSLYATYLGASQSQPLDGHATTAIISKQVFHSHTVPNWVNKPVQGVWLNGSQLYVAMIDEKGVSHVVSYQLAQSQTPQATEIATTAAMGTNATEKHILTSPTASSDNQNIYWDDEWASPQGTLEGNIWARQVVTTTSTAAGKTTTQTQMQPASLFQSDGMSFHPQMVAGSLFFLSTNPQSTNTSAAPTATVIATPSPVATTQGVRTPSATPTPVGIPITPTPIDPANFLGGSTKIDPSVFVPQIDDTIQGRVLAFTADGLPETLPQLDSTRIVSALQGGTRYLIWQNSANAFEMYDVVGKYPVNVGSSTVPHDAAFLDINGNTGVWVENSNNNTDSNNSSPNSVVFNTFTWPWPRENSSNSGHK